jgi:hypothetical protein
MYTHYLHVVYANSTLYDISSLLTSGQSIVYKKNEKCLLSNSKNSKDNIINSVSFIFILRNIKKQVQQNYIFNKFYVSNLYFFYNLH